MFSVPLSLVRSLLSVGQDKKIGNSVFFYRGAYEFPENILN